MTLTKIKQISKSQNNLPYLAHTTLCQYLGRKMPTKCIDGWRKKYPYIDGLMHWYRVHSVMNIDEITCKVYYLQIAVIFIHVETSQETCRFLEYDNEGIFQKQGFYIYLFFVHQNNNLTTYQIGWLSNLCHYNYTSSLSSTPIHTHVHFKTHIACAANVCSQQVKGQTS